MKDIKELLRQFEDIQELPISEEVIGAYMEGRMDDSEHEEVSKIIVADSHLSEMIQDATEDNTVELLDNSQHEDIYEGDYGFWKLDLPPVFPTNDISTDSEEEIDETLLDNSDRLDGPKFFINRMQRIVSTRTL